MFQYSEMNVVSTMKASRKGEADHERPHGGGNLKLVNSLTPRRVSRRALRGTRRETVS
jgi:hypothetical protein